MTPQMPNLVLTAEDLLLAFVLGALIGIERQWRQRTAGLRTNTLVAVGAAIFVDLALRMGGRQKPSGWSLMSFPVWAFWAREPS